ncbi:MAG: hypothetical protein ACNA7W_16585, partial [Pseudomonadales bacterium]
GEHAVDLHPRNVLPQTDVVTVDVDGPGGSLRWGLRAGELATESAALRGLVEQHEQGLLPWPAYRHERGRLLDGLGCSRRRGWRRRLSALGERLGFAGAPGR